MCEKQTRSKLGKEWMFTVYHSTTQLPTKKHCISSHDSCNHRKTCKTKDAPQICFLGGGGCKKKDGMCSIQHQTITLKIKSFQMLHPHHSREIYNKGIQITQHLLCQTSDCQGYRQGPRHQDDDKSLPKKLSSSITGSVSCSHQSKHDTRTRTAPSPAPHRPT